MMYYIQYSKVMVVYNLIDTNKNKLGDLPEYRKLNLKEEWIWFLIYIAYLFNYISMIRYIVLVAGVAFYAFAITNLLVEISI